MVSADNLLSVDQLSNLLRAYLDWPTYVEKGGDTEANEFYLWLADQLDEAELPEFTGGLKAIKHFVNSNSAVLSRARYLKRRDGRRSTNVREDARIAINTQLFFLIYDCAREPALEGTILHGVMLDLARNGMRLETTSPVPQGSVITMTVAQSSTGVTFYKLTGEVRWCTQISDDTSHLGIAIFNIEDFRKWQDFYYGMSSEY